MDDNKKSPVGIIVKLVILAAVLTAIIVFMMTCKLENVEIRGSEIYSNEEIKNKLFTSRLDKYTPAFAYRVNKFSTIDIPFIEKIDVEVIDKNSVIIYVYDKAVTGCIEHMGTYAYFDREGIMVDSSSQRLENIPVIKGLNIADFTLGKKLDTGNNTVFETILDVLMLLKKNNLVTDDIVFGVRNDISLHIDGNEILLGKAERYDSRIDNIASAAAAAGEGKFRFDFRNFNEDSREIDVRKID